jgi:uncharacterized membrane protein
MPQHVQDKHRIETIDLARGLALVAMVIYHFTWDLEFFGYAEPGTAQSGGWRIFARCIATSFLFLVGFSLFMAHGREIRWRGFGRRLATIVAAALVITVATWFATPGSFIFFGILHQIALASVIGLAFIRMPALVVIAIALLVIVAPQFLRSEAFDHPALWWVGLSSVNPRSSDYVPLFPWFGPVLLGIAVARIATAGGLIDRLRPVAFGRWSSPIQWIGRHSLGFYLVHQPVLIAGLFVFAQAFPAPSQAPETAFVEACQVQCAETNDEMFCARYCSCMIERIDDEGRIDEVFSGGEQADTVEWLEQTAAACTIGALEPEDDQP